MPELLVPLITPLLADIGLPSTLSLFGASISVASVTANVIAGIITVGVGLLLMPSPPKPDSGQFAIQQSVPPRIYGYGTARIAGYIAFLETLNGYLFQVNACVGHECNAVVGYYLNDDLVTLTGAGGGGGGTAGDGDVVNALGDGRYGGYTILFETRLGLATETVFPEMNSDFPGVWGTDHRGDGVASLFIRCSPVSAQDFGTTYPYARPQPSCIWQLAKVFDPRDPTQSATDASTWKWSANAALCILHFQCFSAYGPQRAYATAVEPVLSQWIAAANICDEQVALKAGGTEPRYQLGGYTTTEQDPRSTLQTMLQTCDGFFVERGDGTIVLIVGLYAGQGASVTLTDDAIVGYSVQDNLPDEDKINYMTATWTSPDNGYTTVETDPVQDTADQLLRGKLRTARLPLTWCQSNGQASRLLKRESIRQKAPVRGQLMLRLSAINAFYERWIFIDSPTIPLLDGKVIENRRTVISTQSVSTMDFIQVGAEIDDYNPATDESTPPTVPTRPTTEGLPIPANVAVVAEQVTTGTLATVFLSVSWDTPLDSITGNPNTNISYIVQYRLHSGPGQWIQQEFQPSAVTIAASRDTVSTAPVPAGTTLDVQVAATGSGPQTAFSAIVQVNTDINSTAPSTPTGLTATGAHGSAALSCTNPNSSNFSGVQFYRAVTGNPFSSAMPAGGEIFGAPNATSAYTDTVSAGTYDYFVVALNSFGTASSPAGPATTTVT